MKPVRLFVFGSLVQLVLLAAAAQPSVPAPPAEQDREQIDENYDLNAGARVSIRSINGPVRVRTWSQSKAEVHITKISRKGPEGLKLVEVIIEHNPDSLEIQAHKRDRDERAEVTVRVEVTLPRQIRFSVSGINGPIEISAIDGPVKASGINGRVRIDQADGELDVSGINGSVQASVASVGSSGIRVSGVNGSVALGIPGSLNADIEVTGHNGSIDSDLTMTITGHQRRNEFHGQIGSGGFPIRISGVNGSIRLHRSRSLM